LSPYRSRRRALSLPLALAALAATACATHAPQDSLKPRGPESRYIDHLFFPVFWVAAAMFFFVASIATYCVVRFRERTGDEAPVQVHGNTKLELTWTVIPFLMLMCVAIASVIGIFHLFETPKGLPIALANTSTPNASSGPAQVQGDVLEVNVFAHRWWFEYRYPGLGPLDPATGKPGDLITANELHIPAGKMAHLTITANEPAASPEGRGPGVIHNYWVPELAGKIYAVPGHLTHLNLEADSKQITNGHPITYSGQCSEYCGLSHANMRIKVVGETLVDFASWVAGQDASAQPITNQYPTATAPNAGDVYDGYTLFNGTGGCATCHMVSGTPAAGQVGPNLTHLESRQVFAGSIFEMNDNNLRVWLRNPQAAKPGANMKIRKLNEGEISKLVAYLDTLK